MLKKQDIATDVLVGIMLLLLFSNQFMFQSAARIGEKIGLTAKESLGANYPLLLIGTIVLGIFVVIKGTSELLNFMAGIIASICLGGAILFAGQAANVVELP